MSQLTGANVQKCLDILKRFHEVAKVDSGNEELKKRAGEALKHLDNLFAPDTGDFEPEGNCSADCAINVQVVT